MSGTNDNLLNLLGEQIYQLDVDIARWQQCEEHRKEHLRTQHATIVGPKEDRLAKAEEALKLAKALVAEAKQEKIEAETEFQALKDAKWNEDEAKIQANLSRLRKKREDRLKELNELNQRLYFPMSRDEAIAGGFTLIEGAKLSPAPKKGGKSS